MANIRFIGNNAYTEKYKQVSNFDNFISWFKEQKVVGFDVETNVVDSILDRELRVLQFGSDDGEILYVIQWSFLTDEQQTILLDTLEKTNIELIVFTSFEYTIFRKYGIRLKNLWDAYSVEKVLNTGYTVEGGYYSLQGTIKRRFDMDISKAMQCEFGDDILTDQKIEYAAIDVYKLGALREIQKNELDIADNTLNYCARYSKTGKNFTKITYSKGLNKTVWWENEFSKVLGDMEYVGMQHDRQKWIENYNIALPIVEQKTKELNSTVLNYLDREFLINNQFYTDVDIFKSYWNSSAKKHLMLSLVFPTINKVSKVELKKFLCENDPDFPKGLKLNGKKWDESHYRTDLSTYFGILKLLISRTKDNQEEVDNALNSVFKTNFRDELIEEKLLILADTILINWASPLQKLPIFQEFNSDIENTTAQTVEDNFNTHDFFKVYSDYADSNALITKFGLKYLDNVDADGRIRTRFNPILTTGRIASSKPNLLQLPSLQRYRDTFIASPGCKIVGADYSSEEILIIAVLSKDPNWLASFKNGDDVHSVNASLIFRVDWENAIEDECVFVTNKQKCKCKGHIEMRKKSKAISFGLSYGLSAHGASIRLRITLDEAKDLISRFFSAFPNIHDTLESYGIWGYKKGYILEPVLGRVRFYDKWKIALIKKNSHSSDLGYHDRREAEKHKNAIIRESKNMPIQGAGAGILKIACVLLRRYILNNNLQDVMFILLPPHDEILLDVKEDYAELAAEKLTYYMELAGKLALKTDLLKAESYIDNHWVK